MKSFGNHILSKKLVCKFSATSSILCISEWLYISSLITLAHEVSLAASLSRTIIIIMAKHT